MYLLSVFKKICLMLVLSLSFLMSFFELILLPAIQLILLRVSTTISIAVFGTSKIDILSYDVEADFII